MAVSVTLAELREGARLYGNLRGAQSPTDAQIDAFVNRAIRILWQRLTAKDAGFGGASTTLSTSAGVESVALPVDHLATRALYRPDGSDLLRVELTTEPEYRDVWPGADEPSKPGVAWFTPTTLVLRPVPTSVESLRLVYVVAPTKLVGDGDTIDVILALDEAIMEYAAGLGQSNSNRRAEHLARAQGLITEHVGALRRHRGATRLF